MLCKSDCMCYNRGMEYLKEVKDSYKIVTVLDKDGDICYTHLSEDEINFVLLFRGTGTGRSRRFKDILIEWHSIIGQNIVGCLNEVESQEGMCTLVEFIQKRNYQIIFEPEDILLVNRHKAV